MNFTYLLNSLLWLVTVAITLLLPNTVSAETYYISPSGSDSSTGTSPTSAFQTPTKAHSLLTPGDTMVFAPGNYPAFTLSKSGTASLPLTLLGNGAVFSNGGTINISGSYWNITNIEVAGSVSHGIQITGTHISLDSFSVYDGVTENKSGDTCRGDVGWGSGLKIAIGGQNINLKNPRPYGRGVN